MTHVLRIARYAIIAATAVSISLSGSPASFATDLVPSQRIGANPEARAADLFLQKQFVNGQFVSGFTPGKPDFGFSLEGLLQRAALGESASQLAPAKKYLLIDQATVGTAQNPNGFLFADGKLKLGLAGKWAFVGAVTNAKNSADRRSILNLALAKIDGSGDIAPDAKANTYDRAWLVLAFAANRLPKQASLLASNLAAHQLADGGFNDGFTLGSSSTDGTGITLQALAAALPNATKVQSQAIKAAIGRSKAYLASTLLVDHFASYGDSDVNGTAYAAMGLGSVGVDVTKITAWLKADLAQDGGLQTPWSGSAGDTYATAQGALAASGGNYVQLILTAHK